MADELSRRSNGLNTRIHPFLDILNNYHSYDQILKHAVVREISPSYRSCVSSHPKHHLLNLTRARQQHEKYVTVLEELGLDIIKIQGSPDYPDCCFVEDTAIIHNNKVFITRMGVSSREGEQSEIATILSDYFPITCAKAPATIEGGDVIHTEKSLISGITQRTNLQGISQASTWLGVEIKRVSDPNIVHLKSYATYLGNNNMLMTEEYLEHPAFEQYHKIIVPPNEIYAANTLSIGNTTLLPSDFPETCSLIEELGHEVIIIDTSEFQKCEGALTCLSLIF